MAILNWIVVMVLAALPISEVRGAILYGLGVGLAPVPVLLLGIIINILIIPILFYLLRIAHFRELAFKLFRKKAEAHIHKNKMFCVLEELALFAFVAVPLPLTGAWTGVLISELLGWNWKKSFIAIAGGVIVAGILVFLGIAGLMKLFGL